MPSSPKIDRAPLSLFPFAPVWTLALNNQLAAPPAYDETRAYFVLEGDRVAAYTMVPGERTWLVSARPQMQPVAGGGLLFLVEPDALTALHAVDGSIAWQLPFAEKLSVHPVWDNGWLVLATEPGEILAFRAADGYLVWRRDLKSPAHALPALAADRVYVPTTDKRVVALQVESGEPLWERRLGGAANDILALDERLYTGSTDNFFYCLKANDGRVAWRWRTGGDAIGQPVADEGRVYFVALDNILRALDLKTGVQQWMRPLPLRPSWGPVKTGATIVVAGLAPSLRAFDMKDGKPSGDLPAGADVAAPPHALDDPLTKAPMLQTVTHDIAKGAVAALVARSFEPSVAPVSPLPNPTLLAPTLPVLASGSPQ